MQKRGQIHRATLIAATAFTGLVGACATQSASPTGPIVTPGQATLSVTVQEVPVANLPALHSYVLGEANGKWLVIGGRKDGLHKRRPFEAFLAADNNSTIYVIDVAAATVWSASLTTLAPSLAEQLQSTNMQSHQRGDQLYIVGGYGYSATAGDHVTHGFVTAVNVPATIAAIIANAPVAPHIRQLADERLAVTGGYLGELDGTFYLAGGQRFMGRYNPMGPSHGPGFVQEYTNEIRRFQIVDDGTTLAIADYAAWHDDANLHRRDYNMVPQVFPDGSRGFTMFSGVFQYDQNVPWLNTVDIRASGHQVVPVFQQLLSQYHSAHVPLYDATRNEMHTLFFGGMAQYFYDGTGVLRQDNNVPFVRTISMVTRGADGSMKESAIGEMPALLGASAEFIANPAAPTLPNGVLTLGTVPADGIDLGYILGGIQSNAPNVFFSDAANASIASAKLFRVTLKQTTAAAK
ncbi:MAG: hypothetical protein KBG15_01980 [Kofleriaceae bacterium]|nr:hypothetical protein [Kofleriaceae bacterium]